MSFVPRENKRYGEYSVIVTRFGRNTYKGIFKRYISGFGEGVELYIDKKRVFKGEIYFIGTCTEFEEDETLYGGEPAYEYEDKIVMGDYTVAKDKMKCIKRY